MLQNDTPAKTEETTRSPLRTVQILHELALNPAGVSLADLSVRLELPKTSLFRLLKTLETGSYVSARNATYTLGTAALKLGAAIVRNRQFPNCARPVMHAISERCGETIILGTPADNRHQVVYAEVIDATNPLRFISKAGSTNPLYGSASGQVILAYMDSNELAAYLKAVKLVKHAPGTIDTVAELKRRLDEVRATGVSFSLEGLVEGVFSVAAPVIDANGIVAAGLSISAPSSRGLKMKHKFKALALEGGEEISRLLGYAGAYPLPGPQA
ncbi:IclR family transcriptional regulator [Bordetella sp. BOR01]|nr:IclR family transcriptional regulator [Bordetella sp. BOR01]